jgi:hypothetical protein
MKMKKVDPRRFEGKRIEYASYNRVEEAGELADDFMFEIFEFDAGEYLITDESSLSDFTEFGSSNTDPLWKTIEARYRIDRTDVASERLVDIFEAIIRREQVR